MCPVIKRGVTSSTVGSSSALSARSLCNDAISDAANSTARISVGQFVYSVQLTFPTVAGPELIQRAAPVTADMSQVRSCARKQLPLAAIPPLSVEHSCIAALAAATTCHSPHCSHHCSPLPPPSHCAHHCLTALSFALTIALAISLTTIVLPIVSAFRRGEKERGASSSNRRPPGPNVAHCCRTSRGCPPSCSGRHCCSRYHSCSCWLTTLRSCWLLLRSPRTFLCFRLSRCSHPHLTLLSLSLFSDTHTSLIPPVHSHYSVADPADPLRVTLIYPHYSIADPALTLTRHSRSPSLSPSLFSHSSLSRSLPNGYSRAPSLTVTLVYPRLTRISVLLLPPYSVLPYSVLPYSALSSEFGGGQGTSYAFTRGRRRGAATSPRPSVVVSSGSSSLPVPHAPSPQAP